MGPTSNCISMKNAGKLRKAKYPPMLLISLNFENLTEFISVLCNGLMDSAVIEKECIYTMFVDHDSSWPVSSFFSLQGPPSKDSSLPVKTILAANVLDDVLVKLILWCVSHCLKLALNMHRMTSSDIDTYLYYLYEKLSKKNCKF